MDVLLDQCKQAMPYQEITLVSFPLHDTTATTTRSTPVLPMTAPYSLARRLTKIYSTLTIASRYLLALYVDDIELCP